MLRRRRPILCITNGTVPIALGLAVLSVSAYLPALPVVSAMALVALGATGALGLRLASSPQLATAVAVHLVVYVSLYLLFVGAAIHAATCSQNGLGQFLMLDLSASALLMATVMRKAVATIFGAAAS